MHAALHGGPGAENNSPPPPAKCSMFPALATPPLPDWCSPWRWAPIWRPPRISPTPRPACRGQLGTATVTPDELKAYVSRTRERAKSKILKSPRGPERASRALFLDRDARSSSTRSISPIRPGGAHSGAAGALRQRGRWLQTLPLHQPVGYRRGYHTLEDTHR